MLTITHLSKTYGGAKPRKGQAVRGPVKAVEDLSLELRPGEIFGFIGPNGAGKTTTIKMITGILTPDEGEIRINGHDLATDPLGAKRSFGYVPDDMNLYERLSGREYLNFIADIYEVPAEARQAAMEHFLNLFEIRDAVGDPIRSYSRGMRQKLVITGALLHNPPLWVLDEPLMGLDPRSSFLLKEQMKAHCAQGHTVFFSTHVLEVAERLCDRIGIIAHGKLVAVGTLEDLRSGRHDSTADLEALFLQLTGATEEAQQP